VSQFVAVRPTPTTSLRPVWNDDGHLVCWEPWPLTEAGQEFVSAANHWEARSSSVARRPASMPLSLRGGSDLLRMGE
jgi:hypothetical protein